MHPPPCLPYLPAPASLPPCLLPAFLLLHAAALLPGAHCTTCRLPVPKTPFPTSCLLLWALLCISRRHMQAWALRLLPSYCLALRALTAGGWNMPAMLRLGRLPGLSSSLLYTAQPWHTCLSPVPILSTCFCLCLRRQDFRKLDTLLRLAFLRKGRWAARHWPFKISRKISGVVASDGMQQAAADAGASAPLPDIPAWKDGRVHAPSHRASHHPTCCLLLHCFFAAYLGTVPGTASACENAERFSHAVYCCGAPAKAGRRGTETSRITTLLRWYAGVTGRTGKQARRCWALRAEGRATDTHRAGERWQWCPTPTYAHCVSGICTVW